jgi:hypothetical protein
MNHLEEWEHISSVICEKFAALEDDPFEVETCSVFYK